MSPTNTKQSPDGSERAETIVAEYHRLVAEHVSDVISVHGTDGRFEFVSPSAFEVTGYQPVELEGLSPYDFIHPDDIESVVRPNHQQLLEKKREMFRCRFRHKKGHYVWLEVTNDFVIGDDGEVWKLTTSSRDITRRKKLEDRVRLFENIIEVATDAILVTDSEEQIIYANPVFEKMTGYSFEDVCGQVPGDFLQGTGSDPEVVRQMRETVENREIGTFEILNYKKDGEGFFARLLIQPLYDRLGNHEGFFGLQQDITEEKAARDRMKQLNAELEEKNAKLERLNQNLEEFAYAVSHDLKEPLRNIMGLTDLIEDSSANKLDDSEKELVEMVHTSAERMSSMIEALMDYSRTGFPSQSPAEVRMGDAIRTIRQEFSQSLARKNAVLNTRGSELTLVVYPIAFHRLLQNLVSNCLKHGKEEGPCIDISVSEERDCWKIAVSDDGPGIPKSDQKKIFKLFNRASSSPESNGVGLALCKRIVKLHKGSIVVVSTPGNGTTFYISISKGLKNTV